MSGREGAGGPLHLFLLPSAGGSRTLFAQWPDALRERLGDRVVTHAVELPGRGSRIAERPPTQLSAYVDELAEQTPPPGTSWAVVGHSFGALLGAEWAARASARGSAPRLLVASAAAPPWVYSTAAALQAPLDELWTRVGELGGLPAQLADSPAARRLFGRALTADFTAAAEYRPGRPMRTGCPVLAVQGENDPLVRPALTRRWQECTDQGFTQRVLPGGHFYARGVDDLIPTVAEALLPLAAAPLPAPHA
ncbi:thioesterase [Streptomyces sp. TRM66268-LWL]|uniref:Thioesterase n=1 Tax=Streptomyces polyasparticus TaxID=2767826 RepID=A0ABR7SL69_9ACTN|nr:alpha/beta fold hydrolase [Streptomyces polyasparticus]MBC9716059.1 thioesterase [Streptomyces polyasparticus]